jgi:hypothetical protein
MELNKENFINEIREFVSDKINYTLIDVSDPNSFIEIEEYLQNENSRYNFLENCIDTLFLENEIGLLKNTYNILSKRIDSFNEIKPEKDYVISFNIENNEKAKIEPMSFIETLNKHIETIERLKNYIFTYIDAIENKTPTIERKGLTDHQTALFFHYIFKALDVKSKTDITKMAGIVLRLIGKEVDSNKVKDHNIYKMLSNPIGFHKLNKDTESKTLQSNLALIKDMFITLGIDTISIENDIKSK